MDSEERKRRDAAARMEQERLDAQQKQAEGMTQESGATRSESRHTPMMSDKEAREALDRYAEHFDPNALEHARRADARRELNQSVEQEFRMMDADRKADLRDRMEKKYGREGQDITEAGLLHYAQMERQEQAGLLMSRAEKDQAAKRGALEPVPPTHRVKASETEWSKFREAPEQSKSQPSQEPEQER
ncbi:hypothetical protein HFU84_12075 [Acidithiobacillus sp. CV18-2]|nr:hypothetical protein [Acidithiobacillus sp. CV18-3]MBU2758351.1 hypothetical protein [Acidithiobacillus sp. BN09-2]MBU2778224.1 hypothetical protein [Acidithiobacillus sp. CV18-2]MBU2799097.1 hypothetical protein [Acidithiobacillus sp. VAN18-4]